MTNEIEEVVTGIKHWNDSLFSITTTRRPTFTFENGQFVMMGIEVDGRRITRPYSIGVFQGSCPIFPFYAAA